MYSGLALLCALTAACSFRSAEHSGGSDDDGDDGACASFLMQLDTCKLQNAFPLTISGSQTFDTDTGVLKNSMNIETTVSSQVVTTLGAEMRVLVASVVLFSPGATLRAQGVRGLAIVASDTITISANARIDVSQGGAGYRGDCGAAAPAVGAPSADGAAGGGGAGLGAAGGDGGDGNSDGPRSNGGRGGAMAATLPEGPTGGCSGADGGKENGSTNGGGPAGRGGGAVYLASAVSITVGSNAGVHAGGGGGGGGLRLEGDGDAGGGGGGSGGSIFLEAPVIRLQGILAANGGGGGEGSANMLAGQSGQAGPFGGGQAAGGGGNALDGADGGAGGHGPAPAGVKPVQFLAGGGGGGGGSVGVIRIKSADAQLTGLVSPAPI